MLAFAARRHLMLWPAALALLALVVSTLAPPAAAGGRLGAAAWGITFTGGIPFVLAARAVARWLGPEWGAWIIPLSVPLGLVPYLAADLMVQRLSRLRSARRP